jgi:hypothetical protein
MSKRPQNGPSFSKTPYKKPKPLTDEELAKAQARLKEREEQIKDKAAQGRRFGKAVRDNGGVIPISGGNAAEFWDALRKPDDAKQSKRFIEAAREVEADDTEKGADRAFKKVVKSTRRPSID